jgi:5'-nucleotidase (lipoprotein e(P4) family)
MLRRLRRASLAPALLLLLLAAGCTSAPAPAPVAAPPPVPADEAPELSRAIHWVRNSAEHRALYLQTFRLAAEQLETLATGLQPFTWAIATDADETILDNSRYQKERWDQGLDYTVETWNAWTRRREATALPGARDFLETVRRLGGKIAVVTNRRESTCAATEDNLRALRLPFDVVLCRPEQGPGDKEPRFQAVENGRASKYLPPLPIVMYLGDNVQDFPGSRQSLASASEDELAHFGKDWILFPNPMYGSWQGNPQN